MFFVFKNKHKTRHVILFPSKIFSVKIYAMPEQGRGRVDNMWITCGKLGTFPTVVHTVIHIGRTRKTVPSLDFLKLSTFPPSLLLRLLLPYTIWFSLGRFFRSRARENFQNCILPACTCSKMAHCRTAEFIRFCLNRAFVRALLVRQTVQNEHLF